MPVNGYEYSNLKQEHLEEIKRLEGQINRDSDKEIILLAFNKEK